MTYQGLTRTTDPQTPVAQAKHAADPTMANAAPTIARSPLSHPMAASVPLGPPNQGGLPMALKTGIESLSGIAMDDVRVHRQSSRPAAIGAHAYAQGRDIHLAPGQERHLPHEAWHVVQQKQGRVRADGMLGGGVAYNGDAGLEREADVMGAASIAGRSGHEGAPPSKPVPRSAAWSVAQCVINPDWSAITSVKASAGGTQVGVFFVTGADGTEFVVKFEPNAAPEAFASEFIRTMSGGDLGPEATLVSPASEQAGQLRAALEQMHESGGLPPAAAKLLEKLADIEGPDFIVMEKAQGVPMHPDDNPDPTIFQNPSFIKSLGELGAYDIALANYDRVIMGFNLGNVMHDRENNSTTGIDQTAREEEIGIRGSDFVQRIVGVIGNPKEASAWSTKQAGMIEALYGVTVDPRDLDTGFVAGLLNMRERIEHLATLMQSPVGMAAGAAAGATTGRLAAYLEALEPMRAVIAEIVAQREIDIADRARISREALAQQMSSSSSSSSSSKAAKKDKCFLTTACVEARQLPDDCMELRTLRRFRDGFLQAQPDGPEQIAEYYRIAPPIVAAIDSAPDRAALWNTLYDELVWRSVELIQHGRRLEAMQHYRAVVLALKRRYVDPGAARCE